MVDTSSNWPLWGSTGDRPADGIDKQGGDPIFEDEYDYLWYYLNVSFEDLDAAVNDIEDGTTTVTDATNVTGTYKGNDIDTNGDGTVDNAETATTAEGLTTSATETVRPDLTEGGVLIEDSPTGIDVTGGGATLTSDGDGSVTLDISGSSDTHVSLESGGVTILADPDALDAGDHLTITSDGDNTATIDGDGDADTYKGNDIDTNGDGKVDSAAQADNADTVDGKDAGDFHQEGNQAVDFIVENRTSDPSNPSTGREWVRTDL